MCGQGRPVCSHTGGGGASRNSPDALSSSREHWGLQDRASRRCPRLRHPERALSSSRSRIPQLMQQRAAWSQTLQRRQHVPHRPARTFACAACRHMASIGSQVTFPCCCACCACVWICCCCCCCPQDSDEEVLVALEDVLAPHPDDLLDAAALGLTSQVCTHMCVWVGGGGCGCGWVGGLGESCHVTHVCAVARVCLLLHCVRGMCVHVACTLSVSQRLQGSSFDCRIARPSSPRH